MMKSKEKCYSSLGILRRANVTLARQFRGFQRLIVRLNCVNRRDTDTYPGEVHRERGDRLPVPWKVPIKDFI